MDWDKFPLKDRDPINTAFPILFVSNSRDPITPIRSGLAQSRNFVNAGFIEQESEGHCSSAMVSLCTMRKIQAYFSHGIVPDKPRFHNSGDPKDGFVGNWTTCEVDQRPWDVPGPDLQVETKYTAEDLELFRAGVQLQPTVRTHAHFLPFTDGFKGLPGTGKGEIDEVS